MALTALGDRWVAPKHGPPMRFEHRTCGEFFTPEVVCSHCRERIDPGEVVAHGGPGGRGGRGTRLVAKLLRQRQRAAADHRR